MGGRIIPHLSLTETTNEFMLGSFNNDRKYFMNYLSHAKWIWKSLLWNTVIAVKHKWVEVDFSTDPPSIVIPKDCVRFINLTKQDDCYSLQSLSYRDDMAILPKKLSKNACEKCGEENVLGECVNNMTMTQKNVEIDDVSYVEKLWKKVCDNGDVVEIREFPVKSWNSATPGDFEIVYRTHEQYICHLEKKPCGCVKNTDENRTKIIEHCGCFLSTCQEDLCNRHFTAPYKRNGLMKIRDGRIYLQGPIQKEYIISYQTNGDCLDDELMIPEMAVDSVHFGMVWRASALSGLASRLESREKRRNYKSIVNDLQEFLNPIIVSDFMDAQGLIPKWGSVTDQCDIQPTNFAQAEYIMGSKGLSIDDISQLLDQKLQTINGGGSGVTIVNGEEWGGEW